jgi:hypothetical protein
LFADIGVLKIAAIIYWTGTMMKTAAEYEQAMALKI